jgi:ribosomal-protein-alanine N-acetyltransferase
MTAPKATVRLRAVEQRDVEQWRAWINDPEVMEGLDRVLPATEEEHRRFIERHVAGNDPAVWFSIEADGAYVGNVWLWDVHWRHRRAEVRLFVGERAVRGSGVGTAAIAAISEYAFGKLGLHKLVAYVHASNEASRKAFEAAGYDVEGELREEAFRDGAFHAVARMARLNLGAQPV